ncbi:hypothetical protein CTAM01_01733 [Colletotrichum tamarilloi]|uniref:Secreted protein n=1 Tax=Colletotrichum tamarilloi TaxID=1209934 RepID=A0ABQ9RPC0_9PEZI|nr:uncharacterized protein CTAM01_01733 [Colletotrichum tamarilloi]KAK1509610.1 hypothetical protein CTAM01_01733 [Colletotrichum tamarilloi]
MDVSAHRVCLLGVTWRPGDDLKCSVLFFFPFLAPAHCTRPLLVRTSKDDEVFQCRWGQVSLSLSYVSTFESQKLPQAPSHPFCCNT